MAPRDGLYESDYKAFPPMRQAKKSERLTDAAACTVLSNFMTQSSKKRNAYLHPDSILATHGILHGPSSGPSGGITMHYLRRIEAGLRGEDLAAETREELVAKFGEDAINSSAHVRKAASTREAEADATVATTQDGDEVMPDVDQEGVEADEVQEDAAVAGANTADEKKARKAAKKARRAKEKQEQQEREEQEEPEEKLEKSKKKKRKAQTGNAEEDWESKETFDQSRKVVEGEVGNREGAPVVAQNGEPPVVVQHDADGDVHVPKKARTKEEKALRKAAKKAKREEAAAAKQGEESGD